MDSDASSSNSDRRHRAGSSETAECIDFSDGGYRFIKGTDRYSLGVVAFPGYRLERVRFLKPPPLHAGFKRAREVIENAGRPATALCACELRSPAPLAEDGFRSFNTIYCDILKEWGLLTGELNPVTRSNVCPMIARPAEPMLYAFTFIIREDDAAPSFQLGGSLEAPELAGNLSAHVIRPGETGPEALRDKARWVLGEMETRLRLFDAGWDDVASVHLYTVHDAYFLLADEMGRRGVMTNGLTWFLSRPPVQGLEFEMDCRSVPIERLI